MPSGARAVVTPDLFRGGLYEDANGLPDGVPWDKFFTNRGGRWSGGIQQWAILATFYPNKVPVLYEITRNIEYRAAIPIPGWPLRQPLVEIDAAEYSSDPITAPTIRQAIWTIHTTAKISGYIDVARVALTKDPADHFWPHVVQTIADMTTACANAVYALVHGNDFQRKHSMKVYFLMNQHLARLLDRLVDEPSPTVEDETIQRVLALAGADFLLYLKLVALRHNTIVLDD